MNPWPISPLGTKDLDFAIVAYGFTGLTADGLAGTLELLNAIDATLVDFGTSIADQTVLIASMTGDLDDLGLVLNEMATDDFQSVLGDLAGVASAGDSLLGGFLSLFTSSSPAPPAPTPPPTPKPAPIGGSGGSGGGGTTGTGGVSIPPESAPGPTDGGAGGGGPVSIKR